MTIKLKPRYVVGQEIYAIAFHHTKEMQCTSDLLFFFKNNFPDKVSFTKFEVVSQHQVPVSVEEYSATTDGYIVRNPKGVVFHNQYPWAVTSDVSGDADEQFTVNLAGMTNVQALSVLNKNNYEPCNYVDIKKVVAQIYVGSIDNGTGTQNKAYLQKYKDLYKLILSTFEEQYPNKKIRVMPVLNELSDGSSGNARNTLEAHVMEVELIPA